MRCGLLLFGVWLVAAAVYHLVVQQPTAGFSGKEVSQPASHANMGGLPSDAHAMAGIGSLTGVRLADYIVPAAKTDGGTTSTPWGPLTAADRDLLVRVRQAGLWEMPSGTWAQTQAGSQRVKEVGAILASDHQTLDVQVRALADKLGVTLPDQPNADQQGWLAEMKPKTGAAFDTVFANRLRAAHGKVFAIVSVVRAATNNDLIRQFAQVAVNVVMKHMTLLESTGIVDYAALPPASTASSAASTTASTAAVPVSPTAVRDLLILGIFLSLVAYVLYRFGRPRSRATNH
jgi:predicted outer membrane protein